MRVVLTWRDAVAGYVSASESSVPAACSLMAAGLTYCVVQAAECPYALALMSRVEEDTVPAHMVHLFPVRLLHRRIDKLVGAWLIADTLLYISTLFGVLQACTCWISQVYSSYQKPPPRVWQLLMHQVRVAAVSNHIGS